MDSASQPKRLAPWKIRMFGFALVMFGGLMAAFCWAVLQRPEIKVTCQYEYTADPACKRRGIWGGLVFLVVGLPFLFAPSRWLDPGHGATGSRQP
jgi:hypothetical protein